MAQKILGPVKGQGISKIGFRAGTKVLEDALHKCSEIFGLTQKIWTGTKHFATCKMTRHQSKIPEDAFAIIILRSKVFRHHFYLPKVVYKSKMAIKYSTG